MNKARRQNPFAAVSAKAEKACRLNLPQRRVTHITEDDTYRRWWLEETRQRIDRTCVRIWRPKKRLRQELRETTETEKMELFAQLYSHQRLDLVHGQGPIRDPSGEREVLVPNLITFVLRGAAAADGVPKTEIKYLTPGERVNQDSAGFCQALTDSFSCERVVGLDIAHRWDAGVYHMRRQFLGKFANPRGADTRGGIGLITKDTIHYHQEHVQLRVLEAEERLYNADVKNKAGDLHKINLCVATLKKRNRGHGPNL
ncbi:hypothetical protein VTI74DRAFT_8921 [Chaetomium olivicolor]